MNKKQLFILCVCQVIIFVGIAGLISLMPVYLSDLGADATLTGLFLAFAYLCLAASTIVGGRLSDQLQNRKKLLTLGGLVAVPLAVLMSTTTNISLLMILVGCLWFATGTALTMANILGGLLSEEGDRERVFGFMGISASLGLLLGAFVSGPIVDRWDFPALLRVLAAAYALLPLAGILVEDKPVFAQEAEIQVSTINDIFRNRTFLFLFIASIVGQAANCVIWLTRPLIMDDLGFSATEITNATALGSLITLPLPLFISNLSGRWGRKTVIIIAFVSSTVGLMVMVGAVEFWQFWVASILQTVFAASVIVGTALVADLFPKEILGTSLSLFHATPWIGIVIGLSSAGASISAFEMTTTLIMATVFSIVAITLLVPMAEHRREIPYGVASD
jgi:MFS family permease